MVGFSLQLLFLLRPWEIRKEFKDSTWCLGRFLDSGGVYKLAFGPKAFIVVSDPVVVPASAEGV